MIATALPARPRLYFWGSECTWKNKPKWKTVFFCAFESSQKQKVRHHLAKIYLQLFSSELSPQSSAPLQTQSLLMHLKSLHLNSFTLHPHFSFSSESSFLHNLLHHYKHQIDRYIYQISCIWTFQRNIHQY